MSLPLQMFRRRSTATSTRPTISWPVDSNRPDAPSPPRSQAPSPQSQAIAEGYEDPVGLKPYPYHAYTTADSISSINPPTSVSSGIALTLDSSNPPRSHLERPSFSDYDSSIHSPARDRYCDVYDDYYYEEDGEQEEFPPEAAESCPSASSFSFDLSAYFTTPPLPPSSNGTNPPSSMPQHLSDAPPTPEKWAEAGATPITDSEGNARPFSTLYSGPDAIGERQLIIFVRHFFCGACQAYLRALSRSITLETYFRLPTPASITIVGMGDPRLIPEYRRRTGCPFPIYTDPSKELYRALGMGWTVKLGWRAEYMDGMNEVAWLGGQLKQMKQTQKDLRFRGGNWLWVGGEFLVEGGEVRWCRRMRTYRGHSDVSTVRKLLGVEETAD